MKFTVSAVDQEREGDRYQAHGNNLINYRVKFTDDPDMVVQLSQKDSTPAPKKGDVLEGTIDMSGKFGPKFKKDYGGGFGDAPKSGGFSKNKPIDTHTMYVSYAKDVVVAMIAVGGVPSKDSFKEEYAKALEHIRTGATVLEMLTSESNEGIEPPEGF